MPKYHQGKHVIHHEESHPDGTKIHHHEERPALAGRVKRLEQHEEMEHGESMKKLGSSRYDSYENRRRDEIEAGGMINEDHNAIANLPQGVIMKEYPKSQYASYEIDDTIEAVDEQNRREGRKLKRGSISKY